MSVPVLVQADDTAGGGLTILWSASAGRFSDASAEITVWTARPVGEQSLRVVVMDIDGRTASRSAQLQVTARDQCEDADGDGFGDGVGCIDVDCNDDSPVAFAGAPEVCDGIDNDCDERVGVGLDVVPSSILHCGGCDILCAHDHASSRCDLGECTLVECDRDWHDADEAPDNGCEIRCVVDDPRDEVCDGRDNDCDFRVDEDGACETFDAGAFEADGRLGWRLGSLLREAGAVPTATEGALDSPFDLDGGYAGYTAELARPTGPEVRISFRVGANGPQVAAGVFVDDARAAGVGTMAPAQAMACSSMRWARARRHRSESAACPAPSRWRPPRRPTSLRGCTGSKPNGCRTANGPFAWMGCR